MKLEICCCPSSIHNNTALIPYGTHNSEIRIAETRNNNYYCAFSRGLCVKCQLDTPGRENNVSIFEDGLVLDPTRIGGLPVAQLEMPATATIMVLGE